MAELTKDNGVLGALVVELESHRLPRLIELKKKVDDGHTLDDADIQFLEEFQHTASASSVQRLIEQHPEYEDLFSRVVDLHSEIVATASKNEKQA
jgi:hypothetical protein